MDLEELTSLIAIRQYVVNSTGNPAIDRTTVNYLNGLLLMVDKKIISLLSSDQFKEYISYKDVKKAIQEVALITNIKSGIKQ